MATAPIAPAAHLPLFDGFPYLVTLVVSLMHHITILPEDVSEQDLVRVAVAQGRANRLDVYLVIEPQKTVYLSADGFYRLDGPPPNGGLPITGRLRPSTVWSDTVNLQARQCRLASFIEARTPKGDYAMFGDLTKGGREANADQVALLAGAGPEGMPRGLERCLACGEWRGSCLDPSPEFFCKVMTVHCRCANENRCAACKQFLYERKLNANYYNPRDRQIWHVPGFSGLRHRCL
jgi:hypothetical protein